MTFYTDGSAHPNPGPGGYGIVGVDENEKAQFVRSKQYDSKVTNNEMELKAILYTMLNFGVKLNDDWTQIPIVYSDSAYCVNTFNTWMFFWEKRGWLKSDFKPPENLEIIQAYYEHFKKGYRIDLRKIKGHVGQFYNELADKLATGKITEEEVIRKYG